MKGFYFIAKWSTQLLLSQPQLSLDKIIPNSLIVHQDMIFLGIITTIIAGIK